MSNVSHPKEGLFCLTICCFSLVLSRPAGAAEPAPVFGEAYNLRVTPREDSRLRDPETGTELLFLTNAKQKDTHLYFHQRSWLADGSIILFSSNREQGGLMGYIVETGELARITAADGTPVGNVTAAVNRNSVLGMSGDRVLEIQLTVNVKNEGGTKQAKVIARERHLCTVPGINGTFNESCDGRRIAAGQKTADSVGIVIMDEQTGKWSRLCKIPEGVEYHVHVQWSTTNPNWLSFAGAPNRLWVIDTRDAVPWCPYRERPDELVTHESWWVDDQLIFCGGVHAKPTEESHVKTIDLHTGTIRIMGAGSWWPDAKPIDLARRNWWHASGSPDGRWIAADNWHGDIMLFEGRTTRPRLLTTNHRTYGSGEHPEVGWDRKGEQVVFGSHKIGGTTVCVATIPADWQKEVGQMLVGLEAKQQTGP